eukprot:CAMPEP_0117696000 /NCGR_PEP_ID=MMETSP0804-20121206/28449_1 /TAXON_ID=1074897 /ORGANISM="Tetraselmis astigmatica, Strain CCMP880" /LENGTH=285 /DNA_ID=CAMNT_0005510129 /DNA_START=97 /DNA_END=956 /DNA_ORIENTATION=-
MGLARVLANGIKPSTAPVQQLQAFATTACHIPGCHCGAQCLAPLPITTALAAATACGRTGLHAQQRLQTGLNSLMKPWYLVAQPDAPRESWGPYHMYYSLKTDEYEFLIAMSSDGTKLDLRSCFIVDDFTGISSRAGVDGGVPEGFRPYLAVPWAEEDTGDIIMGSKPSTKIPRYYFLEEMDGEQMSIAEDQIYLFDVAARQVSSVPIEKGKGWDEEDSFLRIMADGRVVIESVDASPTPEVMAREHFKQFVKDGGLTKGRPVQDEDDEDNRDIEFDLDVPEVDM